jgi:hypothetical protein
VELALLEVDSRSDADDATRKGARKLIEGAMGRGMDVLVAAAVTDVGELALEAVKHVLRERGIALWTVGWSPSRGLRWGVSAPKPDTGPVIIWPGRL